MNCFNTILLYFFIIIIIFFAEKNKKTLGNINNLSINIKENITKKTGETMGNVNIFNQTSYLFFTYLALFLLFFSCNYTAGEGKQSKGIWLLFWGLFLDFISIYVSRHSMEVYAQGGSVEIWVFAEMLLCLAAMLLLASASSYILLNQNSDIPFVSIFGGLGLIAIVFFLYITPDNRMITSMRYIFPLAGFLYLAIGFFYQMHKKRSSGFVFAGLVTLLAAIFMGLKVLGFNYFISEAWYIPAMIYVLLGMALIMMKVDFYAKKYDENCAEIEKYNQKIEEMIKYSPFPIIISRLSDDRIIVANSNAIKLFGISSNELDRYHLRDFFADSDNRKILNERLEKERVVQDFEILVKTPGGTTPFWLLASANIIDYNYDVALYIAFQDITSRKNREVLLKNQAIRDPLTSLYNRRYFEEEVFKRIVAAKAQNEPFSVLMIDADHFKNVNDTYGHKTGDKVLIELASTCEKALRDVDIVARYGGEEFVVFLAGVNVQKGAIVADRLRESISRIVVHSDEGQEVRFTVSIGVSSYEVSDNVDTLIKTADEALYKAKENGRNRVEVFNKNDWEAFDNQEAQDRIKNEVNNRHPIFEKEENEEISLLDGIESNHIQENTTQIEENIPEENSVKDL